MARIEIKKRISLEFLGEEYKEGFVILTSIPLREYEKLLEETAKVEKDDKKSTAFLQKLIADRFVEGKFPKDGELIEITKEDLPDFPAEFFIEASLRLRGKIPENLEQP